MADVTWHYTDNQFDNATKGSKRRMKLLGQHHVAALDNAPAGIKAALLARVTPAYTAYAAKYNEWVNARASLTGATVAYDNLLAALSAEGIEDLETAFKVVHRRGTPEHAMVFAGGRAPYHEGAADERVDALENLRTRMQGLAEPALAGAIAQATALLTPLQAARTASTDAGSAAELARTQIEPLRVALAVALFKNMAGLLQELGASEDVAAFFDLELLRQSGGDEEPGSGGEPSSSSSSSSSSTLGLPTAPLNVVLTTGAEGSGAAGIAWDNPPAGQGVTGFNIYRDGVFLMTAGGPTTLDGFTPGEALSITVAAINATGEGPQSEVATGTAG